MPSLKAIRKRIGSVKNTQKITRAMKLVAAAKLRRAQDAIVAARPYAVELMNVIGDLAERTDRAAHPLLDPRDGGKRAHLVVLTSDRGLAGAFNANVCRRVEQWVREESGPYEDVSLYAIGRKGNEYFKRRDYRLVGFEHAPTPQSALEASRELANRFIELYETNETDRVFLVYNEFKSAISQRVVVEQLLPVVPRPLPDDAPPTDFIYEPSKDELLAHVMPLYVQVEIYRSLLESVASELGARMSAMDSATRNATEMIGKLTLQYNRARQAAITKELLEIIGGAEALKG
ncbi:MAG: ATP synthase F1 subunit gamma [Deltaproteobacteria bacterium]|nr:MAG: ATP synthase F1 subunit gamma [Deltaproteobacteria bacterium]